MDIRVKMTEKLSQIFLLKPKSLAKFSGYNRKIYINLAVLRIVSIFAS